MRPLNPIVLAREAEDHPSNEAQASLPRPPGSTLSQEVHVLRHSLGLTRRSESYRNYFCAGPGSDDYVCCETLVAKGLMIRRRNPLNEMSEDYIFHVTDAGKLAASNDKMRDRDESAPSQL